VLNKNLIIKNENNSRRGLRDTLLTQKLTGVLVELAGVLVESPRLVGFRIISYFSCWKKLRHRMKYLCIKRVIT